MARSDQPIVTNARGPRWGRLALQGMLAQGGSVIRSRPIQRLAIAAAIPAAAVALAGCGGNSAPAPPRTAGGSTATIGLDNDGNLGKILVDSKGDTVYLFQNDTGTRSSCTGA